MAMGQALFKTFSWRWSPVLVDATAAGSTIADPAWPRRIINTDAVIAINTKAATTAVVAISTDSAGVMETTAVVADAVVAITTEATGATAL